MNWTEISITANHDAIPIISNILEEHGSNGVVIEAVSYTHLTLPTTPYV